MTDIRPHALRPGGPAAAQRGCLCPGINNRHGRGFRLRLKYHEAQERLGHIVVSDCPVHRIVVVQEKTNGRQT